MRRWYSPRGARRGLLLAVIAMALWGTWAVVYIAAPQSTSGGSSPSPSPVTTTVAPDAAACCTPRLRT